MADSGYVLTGGKLGPANTVFTWSMAGAGLSDFAQYFPAGTTAFPSGAEQQIRQALQQWSAVANINFIEVPDTGEQFSSLGRTYPNIRFGYGNIDAPATGVGSFPQTANKGSVWIDNKNGFSALTALHEMGHVLGLNHDTTNPAIMNAAPSPGITTLQPDDIAGIQAIYGAQDGAPEMYTMPSGQENLTILDGLPNLTIVGNSLANVIVGTSFDETFRGNAGNDTIDGGGGNNSAVFSGLRSAYTLTALSTGGVQVTGPDGSDTLSNIQHLVFNDQTVTWTAGGPIMSTIADLGTHGAAWPVAGTGDFNADGTSDILWRNPGTGQVDQWQMKNGSWSKSIDLGATKGSQWQLAGVGDFNADGTSDVLWRDIGNSSVDQWQMKNGNWSKSIDLGATKGAQWTLAGVGDFNADGTSDVLWRNISTSQVDQWQMKDGNWSKSIDLGATKGADWQLAGVGDFNGDGTTDVLWRNLSTSQVDQWQMKDGNWSKSIDLGATKGSDWTISGVGDANGDHVSDIFWLNTKTGQSEHWLMSNGNWAGSVNDGIQDIALKPAGIGDFNHDGKSEALLVNADTAHLYNLVV